MGVKFKVSSVTKGLYSSSDLHQWDIFLSSGLLTSGGTVRDIRHPNF
jgi:hypothetical protein